MRYLLPLLVLLTACSSAPKPAEKAAEQPVFQVDAATAGTIRGTIRFVGKRPPVQIVSMDADAQCAKMYGGATMTDEGVVVNSNGTLSNVFVYLKTGLEGKRFATPAEPVTIDQKGCWFHPRVMGIQTGQTFQVTNSDPVTHNIHPQPDKNRDWNQSQSPEDLPLRR
ncbi:MAG TPA: hypothetical protein VFQ91_29120, partial [Bryobacteraceae bacterium]|nr:hypothetical protein [Bryobacteraceae bacterium]